MALRLGDLLLISSYELGDAFNTTLSLLRLLFATVQAGFQAFPSCLCVFIRACSHTIRLTSLPPFEVDCFCDRPHL